MAGKLAPPLSISSRQREILERLSRRRSKIDHQHVLRAQLILYAADGLGISKIAELLDLHRHTVRSLRRRWSQAGELLSAIESGGDEKQLTQAIFELLTDKARSGRPLVYSAEVVCQIIAVSCEDPQECGHPITHWTPSALRREILKRGIVDNISARQIGRFLKRG